MKNTGFPIVSAAGAMGALAQNRQAQNRAAIPFPRNWPKTRVATPEEQARIAAAQLIRSASLQEGQIP